MINIMKQDETLICKDCQKEFLFVVRDQDFFEQHDWPAPVRCRKCQQLRRERYENRQNKT